MLSRFALTTLLVCLLSRGLLGIERCSCVSRYLVSSFAVYSDLLRDDNLQLPGLFTVCH